LLEAQRRGVKTLLTFGGAFSNHILATACLGKKEGLNTIGVIRGDELVTQWEQNPTLKLASEYGMEFHFVDRAAYRKKEQKPFIDGLGERYGTFYLLPEGGTDGLAVKGCEEILHGDDAQFDIIATAVGTGGTMAGLINAAHGHQTVLGFPALKGDFLTDSIRKFANRKNWALMTDYHFGGYAKVNGELVTFINRFKDLTGIPLDPIYTGKLLYGILDRVQKGKFAPHSKILVVHTGGLQGILGINTLLEKKNLPLIHL